jgi:hypothetical protein
MKKKLVLSAAPIFLILLLSFGAISITSFTKADSNPPNKNYAFIPADDTGSLISLLPTIVEDRQDHHESPRYKFNGFVQVSNRNHKYLQLSDGTPFIPVGPNICWPRFETDEEKVMEWMEDDFRNLSANGGNYTRIFLSAPFYEFEYKNAYTYDFTKARRIDRILDLASKYGIKVKFCFEHFRKLTNSPAIFPGSIPFDKPIYHVSNGGPLHTMDEYFSTTQGKELFLKRMEFFSKKYAKNPNVFGWELWNELNAVNANDTLMFNWTKEMLDSAHAYFPNHLVMQTLGSFECTEDNTLYQKYSTIEKNDLAQVHRYLNSGACLDICKGPMDILASDAVRQLLSYNPDKPVILSETGAVAYKHSGPWKLYEVDKEGILMHDLLFAPFFSGAAAPGQSWHWDFYIEKNKLWWHFDRFNQAIKGVNPITEDFQPVFLEDSNLRNYILKGKNTVLIWCRDKASDWQSELIDGKKPTTLNNLTIDLSKMDISAFASVEFYLPWENKWMKGKLDGEKVSMPDFNRSIVIKLKK